MRELAGGTSLVSASQFFGLDIKQFAVELAKVTLMVGQEAGPGRDARRGWRPASSICRSI